MLHRNMQGLTLVCPATTIPTPAMNDTHALIKTDREEIRLLGRMLGDVIREAEGKATLIIAKNRNGATDDVPLTFRKEFTRFEDRTDAPEPGN